MTKSAQPSGPSEQHRKTAQSHNNEDKRELSSRENDCSKTPIATRAAPTGSCTSERKNRDASMGQQPRHERP